MKAWLLHDFTGLAALRLGEDVVRPAPGPGELLLRLHYAALNPADRFLAENLYPARPAMPHILGRDGCGIVEEVGAGVTDWQPGDFVVLLRGEAGIDKPGTLAEYVVVPRYGVVRPPADWNEQQAAAAPLVYETAHQALTQWGKLPPGVVLITGISGGVGLASLHLAKAWGHRVVGVTRGTRKVEAIRAQGADLLVDPNDAELKRRVREFAGRGGVQLIVDNIGGTLLNNVLDTLGYRGCVSVIGALGGPVPSFNTAKLLFRRLRIGGVAVHDYTPDEARAAWEEIVAALALAGRRPVVDSVFPLARLMDAFERLAEGPMGKVLIDVRA